MLVIIFMASVFLSASLLFLVEPMIAKMMLPMLGGTPAVWNTCLVFFEVLLLAGYLYAHATIKWLSRRAQITVHMGMILLPLLIVGLLPLHLRPGWQPPAQSNPVPWIMALLFVSVGLPFFVLSSNAPIAQRWFADSGHKHADDPYFLYAASNTGSLLGLLSYPLLMEPLLRLSQQSHLWSYVYMLFVAVTAASALLVWRNQTVKADHSPVLNSEIPAAKSWRDSLRWIALAFVPSSLTLGVTTALTTDVPAIPLFWVLPLAVYLVSFVLVFARRPLISHEWMARRLPLIILFGLYPTVSRLKFPFTALLVLYLGLLFVVSMVCHGELARSRPQVSRLTEFYLWISVGGVLGGIFNALIAPIIFHSVLEFPIVLILAALLRPQIEGPPPTGSSTVWANLKDWLLPLALGLTMASVILGLEHKGITIGHSLTILIFGYSMIWCLSFSKRRLRFAAGLGALILASSLYTGPLGRILDTERSFFGVYRVTDDPSGKFRYLISGGTLHGMQSLDPARSREPLAYYTRQGPAGQIVQAVEAGLPRSNWAIVGLGAGTMACLAPPGQKLTYYEIDPLVARIALNPRYFTLLESCAPQARIILGDARLKLKDAPDSQYGLIALDAFSGDSIPIHLMTKEALALYMRKLTPHGILAFHISNLYLQLEPILGDLAQDSHLVCMIESDGPLTQSQLDQGRLPSTWVVMARSQTDLSKLIGIDTTSDRWLPVHGRRNPVVWTDDYSDLLRIIKWDGFIKFSTSNGS